MKAISTSIAGVVRVELDQVQDERGKFARLFCEQVMADLLGDRHIVQVNFSQTAEVGTVRGMHLQLGASAELKLVRCIAGRVWDVALDLRHGSATFMHSYAEELTADRPVMLVIPEGCAHGFQVLEADSQLLYFHTAAYSPKDEFAVHCQDPVAAIAWPLPIQRLSARDASHTFLSKNFSGLML